MISYGASNDLTVQLAGPFAAAGSAVKLTQITLPADSWKGGESPYFQTVEVEGVSVSSKVDLQPGRERIEGVTAFTAENEGGAVTVYALGDKPLRDYTLQATLTEVVA